MSALVETNNATLALSVSSWPSWPIPVRATTDETDEIVVVVSGTTEETVKSADALSAIAYLQTEFPTECWLAPNFAVTIAGLLDEFFVRQLPTDPRMEHVYWDSEDDVLKVWVVTSESDFVLEEPIYRAQQAFIERFPTLICDFSVIYRYGKALDDIAPQGARLLR